MPRLFRVVVALALIVAVGMAARLQASHGHGGGGGHMGGGHMGGGGHIGGGHFGGGQMGHVGGHSGHIGGMSGGHPGAVHHFGGAQQFGGAPHHGGVNHLGGAQHFGGAQHLNSVPHHGINSGTMHPGTVHNGNLRSNSLGHQHQALSNSATLGASRHQLNAPFYQHHGGHTGAAANQSFVRNHTVNSRAGLQAGQAHAGSQFLHNHAGNSRGLQNTNLNSLANSQHHGSQFLRNHGSHNIQSAHLSSGQAGARHQLVNMGSSRHSAFLAHHGAGHLSSGNHHSAMGQSGHQHLNDPNVVGRSVHNSLMQNFHYRHNHTAGGGIGNGGLSHRHNYYPVGRHYGGFGYGGLGYRGLGYGGLGWGFGRYYPGYYGYGLGRFGYGWGWGGGLFGYRRWGCFSYNPYFAYGGIGYGYPYYGIGYGYPYSGYGVLACDNGLSSYPSFASLSPGLMGYGYGASYAPPGSATAIDTATDAPPTTGSDLQPPANQVASSDTGSAVAAALPTAEEFAQIGETAFKSRDYKGAVRAWRHGLIDDPDNGVLVLMLAQSLFATGQFNEAAGATQFGMQQLESSKWETVVKNYRELYGKIDDYTIQLRALEKATREKADDPALRFLLGYHYGYLGYPKEAVQQLEKCVSLAAEDEAAQKLLDIFKDRLPKEADQKTAPPAPEKTPAAGTLPPPPPPAGTLPQLNSDTTPPAPKKPENP